MSDELAVSRPEIVSRCLSGECPDCGKALPGGKPLSFPATCPACGMILRRHDGFFLGAVVCNYAMTAFGALPVIVLAWKLGWMPAKVALGVTIALCAALPVLLYRFAWRLWLALYYACLPGQLPVNGAEPADTDD